MLKREEAVKEEAPPEANGITMGELRQWLAANPHIPDDHTVSWVFEDGQEFNVGALEYVGEWKNVFLGENRNDLLEGLKHWEHDSQFGEEFLKGEETDDEDPESTEYK